MPKFIALALVSILAAVACSESADDIAAVPTPAPAIPRNNDKLLVQLAGPAKESQALGVLQTCAGLGPDLEYWVDWVGDHGQQHGRVTIGGQMTATRIACISDGLQKVGLVEYDPPSADTTSGTGGGT